MSRADNGGRWQMRFTFADTAAVAPPVRDRLHVHEPPAPLPGEYRETPLKKTRNTHPRTRSSLPVPKPLPEAIEAGHFGYEEKGSPVRPSRDEVREITLSHAETLRDAVQAGQHDVVEQGIAQYAESFGTEAAERLRSYVQRLAHESVSPAWRR